MAPKRTRTPGPPGGSKPRAALAGTRTPGGSGPLTVRTSRLCVAALVLGLAALASTLLPFLGLILGPLLGALATVLAILGAVQVKKHRRDRRGLGLAVAAVLMAVAVVPVSRLVARQQGLCLGLSVSQALELVQELERRRGSTSACCAPLEPTLRRWAAERFGARLSGWFHVSEEGKAPACKRCELAFPHRFPCQDSTYRWSSAQPRTLTMEKEPTPDERQALQAAGFSAGR